MTYFDDSLSPEGIDYYNTKEHPNDSKWKTYQTRFLYFHNSPVIKMSFHFVSKYNNFMTNDSKTSLIL
jgi:hypothetical protein